MVESHGMTAKDGKIYPEYWIQCPCGEERSLGATTRKAAEKQAHEWDWSHTNNGWRCPACCNLTRV
jgi:hypothetical protein